MIKRSPKLTPNEFVFGFLYFALQLIVIPSLLVVINTFLLPKPLSDAVINFLFFGMNFAAVLLIFHKYLKMNWRIAAAQPWKMLRFAGIGLIFYFFGTSLITTVITWIYPEFLNINDQSIMGMVQDHFGIMVIGTVILVPITEEAFYRGLIFRQLFDRSPVLAYLLSMAAFSIIHIAGYVGMADALTLVLSFFQYLPAGFALAWCYHRTGSIFTSVLLHMTVNQIGILTMR